MWSTAKLDVGVAWQRQNSSPSAAEKQRTGWRCPGLDPEPPRCLSSLSHYKLNQTEYSPTGTGSPFSSQFSTRRFDSPSGPGHPPPGPQPGSTVGSDQFNFWNACLRASKLENQMSSVLLNSTHALVSTDTDRPGRRIHRSTARGASGQRSYAGQTRPLQHGGGAGKQEPHQITKPSVSFAPNRFL